MPFTVYAAPDTEVVSLDEAKEQCRVVGTEEEGLLSGYILAARNYCESICGSAFVTQTLDAYFDSFGWLTLPSYPVQSITSITYRDSLGVSQTVSASNYYFSKSRPSYIVPVNGVAWPNTQLRPDAVTVRFVAGYGDLSSDTPEAIRHAMLMMIAHWFENRESVTNVAALEVPLSTQALLAPYRIYY